jgi:glutathione-regulated potassium-efflux system ancillary protein KefG
MQSESSVPSGTSGDHPETARAPAAHGRRRRVLILFAHPSLERSEANAPMLAAARDIEDVTIVDLYAEYPGLEIDVDREQQRLREHDVICFQHPLYWYSTPAILKEWQDLVLEHGFAYGSEGNALRGKLFFAAITAGGGEAAYCAKGYNHFSIRELLRPLEQTAHLCGMVYLPPFALFGSRTAVEEGRIDQHVAAWIRLLTALRDDRLAIDRALPLPQLSDHLDAVLTAPSAAAAMASTERAGR